MIKWTRDQLQIQIGTFYLKKKKKKETDFSPLIISKYNIFRLFYSKKYENYCNLLCPFLSSADQLPNIFGMLL